MTTKKVGLAVVVSAIVVIIVAVLATGASAEFVSYYIRPSGSFAGVTMEAGSPYAFTCEREEVGGDYFKLLVYLEDSGKFVERVEIDGYYWLEPEGRYICYALWIPDWIPTGKYTLNVCLHGHTWVWISELDRHMPWGPWTEIAKYEYPVTILGGYSYGGSGGIMSVQSMGVAHNNEHALHELIAQSECKETEGLTSLTPAQKEVLLQTLKEELNQKGLA